MPCETQVLISLIFVIKAVSSTIQWKTLCADIFSAWWVVVVYGGAGLGIGFKQDSYGLLVKFDVAVGYSCEEKNVSASWTTVSALAGANAP